MHRNNTLNNKPYEKNLNRIGSCGSYVRRLYKGLEQRVDQLETDVEQLQSGLDALKKAVEDKLTVEDYKQIEGGYELLMSDGTKLYLYNGADGAKGEKGPQGEQGPQGETYRFLTRS